MRKSIIPLLLAFCTLAYGQNTIVIQQKDGKVARFSFTEKPVVTYSGNDVLVNTTKNSVQYPIYLLQKISFDIDWNTTDIEEVEVAEPSFHFRDDALSISGEDPRSLVFLYNIKGMLAGRYQTDDRGCVTIPIRQLRPDLYIVKTNRFSFKFRKP
jgi:hypothetical protein